jgi:hypothetical protein
MLFPTEGDAVAVLATVRDTVAGVGGLDPLGAEVFAGIARTMYGVDPSALGSALETLTPDEARQAVSLLVVLEYVAHPLRPEMVQAVEGAARRLGVHLQLVDDARELAREHFRLLYMDLERQSWYTAETVHQSLRGRFLDLIRSKLAYEGVAPSRAIARKWEGLRDCAPGTWGRAVADFYERHAFPFPGERHGIYELGARHDWVHVLADYETTPEGEIDVFAFIAASMGSERGLVLLAFTLGLFQNASINRVDGKVVSIARSDTLSDPGAVDHFVDALRRGRACQVDVMGTLDLFAHKDDPLDEVRSRFGIPPKTEAPAPTDRA